MLLGKVQLRTASRQGHGSCLPQLSSELPSRQSKLLGIIRSNEYRTLCEHASASVAPNGDSAEFRRTRL